MSGPNYAGERGTPGFPGKEYATQNIELCAKDEEIAQLKAELSQEMTTTQRMHIELMQSAAEIDRLRVLLGRAADALEKWTGKTGEGCDCTWCAFIKELRKAAQ